MKKLLFGVSINKIYIILVALVSLFIMGSYFSFAMFTVTKEKSNAISIVTGNLSYKIEVDGKETNTLTVPTNTTKTFIVTLSNPNNRKARFNFYYVGNIPNSVFMGYLEETGYNMTPIETGVNLEKNLSSGSSNTYKIKVSNWSNNSITITLGVEVGLDYNDLTLPSNGHLFEKYDSTVANVVLDNLSNGSRYNDETEIFVTGEEPNNYIWYSGKLWRAISVNISTKTVKLVTQWNISAIAYNLKNDTYFEDSYMEDWLNDTSIDGFLGNLREPENFLVMDAKWDATEDSTSLGSIERPTGTTVVTNAVGLLNMYEYQESFNGTTYSNGYLNNGLYWWTLTPYSLSNIRCVDIYGSVYSASTSNSVGIRPAINLKSNIRVVDGEGTKDNPYRLEGDNDTNLKGTYLKERYSGEYIRFGSGENTLYRIVSHENGIGTKIVSAEPLKSSDNFIIMKFGNGVLYSTTNIIGSFLNGDYLTNYVGVNYSNMIEDNTTWYLGTVNNVDVSYKLAKYIDVIGTKLTSVTTTAKVGLLRFGELMAGQFDRYVNNTTYWFLTPYNTSNVRYVYSNGGANIDVTSDTYGVKPAFNLKQNVIITSGDGTLQNPFHVELG